LIRIEEFTPFPLAEIEQELNRYPNARSHIWYQEESQNAGAWSFLQPRFLSLAPVRFYRKKDFYIDLIVVAIYWAFIMSCCGSRNWNSSQERIRSFSQRCISKQVIFNDRRNILKKRGFHGKLEIL
jgi:hypothetical protein